jgi:hypothetical protein
MEEPTGKHPKTNAKPSAQRSAKSPKEKQIDKGNTPDVHLTKGSG